MMKCHFLKIYIPCLENFDEKVVFLAFIAQFFEMVAKNFAEKAVFLAFIVQFFKMVAISIQAFTH